MSVLVPAIAIGLVVAGFVLSILKGRWVMGVAGALGAAVGVMWMLFSSFDVRPLEDLEESVANSISLASAVATLLGILLLLLGAVRPPRPGSWWQINRRSAIS